MKINKLQTRIVLAFSLLLLLILAAGLVVINIVLADSTNQNIRQDLLGGQRVFNLLHEGNDQQLVQSASIMSSDFAFRKAVATADYNTVISALNNHGARIKADVLLLVGLDGKMVAHTLADENIGSGQFQNAIALAEQQGQAGAMVVLNGKLYQMVAVPVLGPLPIAWLIAGFDIDDKFVRHLQTVTSLHVSFLSKASPESQWQLLVSTLPTHASATIHQVLPGARAKAGDITTLRIEDEDYMTLTSEIETLSDAHIVAVLQKSLQESLLPLRRLQVFLLFLSGLSLIAVLVASYLIARGIAKPIGALGVLAHRIRQGDYSQSAKIDRVDEIGELASAFNHMADGLAKRESRIADLAYNDQLTGLPNRTLFHERLTQAVELASRSGQSCALLVINLDRFKEVNVVLGHHIGDLLLQESAMRLASILTKDVEEHLVELKVRGPAKRLSAVLTKDEDTFARLGGDEFAVLLPSCDALQAMNVVRKIMAALERPVLLEDQEVVATGSVGIAMYPEHGNAPHTLLRHADIAMRKAKNDNSGYAFFDVNYVEPSRQNLSLMAELRYAIERNEFVLHYQPKVGFATGSISHVEALVRWMHPVRGMIPPNLFIPYAEHTGYIRNITRWVIKAALTQRKQWEEMQLPLTISINISAQDLMNADLPRLFAEMMEESGASPDWLCLEITESAIMADPKRALGILEALHKMGISLSVDDFGTGYSSLAYLKKLPVSELKIDQSFIFNMANDEDDKTIVRSTIDLGHNMGLVVVAEGIEDSITWDMLKDMGCDLAQGYHIGKPMTAETLLVWLQQTSWKVAKS